MKKLAYYALLAFTLLLSACASSPTGPTSSGRTGYPGWSNSIKYINRIVALDGTVFFISYRVADALIGGFNRPLDVLLNEDGERITEPAVSVIPISKKVGVSCTPKENNFNSCKYWDLTGSSPKEIGNNLENFYFDKTGSSATGETRTITAVRLLEYTSGQNSATPTYSLRLINSDLSDKARIDSIKGIADNEKFIKVIYTNGSFENFDYNLKSLTGPTNYEMVNGRAVVKIANTENHYLYYDTNQKKTQALPENVIGYRPILNSDKYFAAVVKTSNGFRYRADLPSGNGNQLCNDIQLQSHYKSGIKFYVIICLNELAEWTAIEVQHLDGNVSVVSVPPNKNYYKLMESINSNLESAASAADEANKMANCMKLSIASGREECIIKEGSYVTTRYLVNNSKPEPSTMMHALTKFYVDPDYKKKIHEKLIAAVKTSQNIPSPTIAYVLQNTQLSDAERKQLNEKWIRTHLAEIEQAKNELRHCIKTANTWASMKERSCAKQLGGEEWYVWLEQDYNASSNDFVEAIAEAKKIGRDTSKLQKTYESVKRSEATTAYYAEKDRREREEKAAFGNIYTIMKNVRENIQAACAQNASYCSGNVANPIMESYNMIQWQQSVRKGGPTWDQINSNGR